MLLQMLQKEAEEKIVSNRRLMSMVEKKIEAAGVPEARYCALFRWLPGKFLAAGLNAKAIVLVGRFLAQLQQYSQNFTAIKGFVRFQLKWGDVAGVGCWRFTLVNTP